MNIGYKLLAHHYPCLEAMEWLGDRDAETAWRECERADWMLWAVAKVGVDRKIVVTAACACARTALRFVPDGEHRPLSTIETTEAWVRGNTTTEDVRAAAGAAAYAAAGAAGAAADAAAYAAGAADAAADAAAYAVARTSSLREMADIVRKTIPWEVVQLVITATQGEVLVL